MSVNKSIQFVMSIENRTGLIQFVHKEGDENNI